MIIATKSSCRIRSLLHDSHQCISHPRALSDSMVGFTRKGEENRKSGYLRPMDGEGEPRTADFGAWALKNRGRATRHLEIVPRRARIVRTSLSGRMVAVSPNWISIPGHRGPEAWLKNVSSKTVSDISGIIRR